MLRLPPLSTLFPYTTLFRSVLVLARAPLLRLVDRPDDVLDREGRPVMPFDVRVQLERVGLRIWRGPAGRKVTLEVERPVVLPVAIHERAEHHLEVDGLAERLVIDRVPDACAVTQPVHLERVARAGTACRGTCGRSSRSGRGRRWCRGRSRRWRCRGGRGAAARSGHDRQHGNQGKDPTAHMETLLRGAPTQGAPETRSW